MKRKVKNQKRGVNMSPFKKVLLSLLSMLPLGSISYAADFESSVDMNKAVNVQEEFEIRLERNELPEKYYNYLGQQNILSMDDLVSERNLEHYRKMLKEFELDIKNGVYAAGGAISIGGTF